MEYRIIQLGDRMSLNRIDKNKEGNNELLNVINDINSHAYLSNDELIDAYFTTKRGKIVKDIKIETIGNDVVINIDYFCHDKNNKGEYYYFEVNNLFYINKNDFDESRLCNKVSEKVIEVIKDRENITNEINETRENIKDLNERVKKITEDLIKEYLKKDNQFFNRFMLNFSFEEIEKYIKENYQYVKEFIQENWRYKKIFDWTFNLEVLITSLGGINSLHRLVNGDDSALVVMLGTITFLCGSLLVSETIEKNLIDKQIDTIKNFEFHDDSKPKTKLLEKNEK